ncbi:MAG TPA: DNA-formamidopyrimidine glycosylase family protein [Myxococcaceae bacterium]|nr:DNA-formamidopyrimidine glycosylase family protein [Myxococcaceae bacterium]
MPEGDTIHRAARTLHRALAGKPVVRFETGLAQLSRVDDDAPIAGRTVERVRSVGKHLLLEFSGDLVLRTHMRMNGSWHVYRPGERWQRPRAAMRVVVETADFQAVAFDVPVAEFRTGRALARDPAVARLGPDVLDPGFDEAEAVRRLRERASMGIGEALLDQRALAGIGNVFKSEVCFAERVHPFTPVSTLQDEALLRLVRTARRFLAMNVLESSGGRMVTYTGLRRTTGRGDPSARLWVYGRGGEPCRECGERIVLQKRGLDARSTYFCPACQVLGSPGL